MSHFSDSDEEWIPLPPSKDLLNPSNLNPEVTPTPPGKIQRKLSDKGWALKDESKRGRGKTTPNSKTESKDNDESARRSRGGVLAGMSLLSLVQSEQSGKAEPPNTITDPATNERIKDLEAGTKSLKFRMDAMQGNITELREAFKDLEVMLAAKGIVREGLTERKSGG